jgi:geranylgeranyl reductase family protein
MITIVGAGPVGCHAASLLASEGNDVCVLEEHKEIGKPVQCTGIVTSSIRDVVTVRKEFLVNKLRKVRVHAPNGRTVDVAINDIVIDRTAFDRHIADKAAKSGAKILTGRKVEGIKQEKGRFKITGLKENADVLIGADGPASVVSRFMGNPMPKFFVGMQALVKMPVEKDVYSVWFGNEFPGFFGWVVPENEGIARVGIAAVRNPSLVFHRFLKKFSDLKVVEMQGGLIPIYNPSLTLQKENSYLVGDAATQVKATTGGGLVPGIKAAECLAKAIINGTSYTQELRSVERELKMSLLLRKMLCRFNDKDYNELIEILGDENMQQVLKKNNRDSPSKLILSALIKQPKLLFFARTIFRAKCL